MNTLKDWIRDANNTHSPVHQRLNMMHPTEETKKLIKAILVSLADLQNSDRYHGVLFKPENYILKRVQNHDIRRDWRYEVKFCEDPNVKYNAETLAEGQEFDTRCVWKTIFGKILPDSIKDYPPDVQNLEDDLQRNHHDKNYLANHPSIWSCQDRFNYFLELDIWKRYNGGKKLRTALGFVQESKYASWQSKIQPGNPPGNNPLYKVLKDGAFYDTTVSDLVRFVRNVFLHITEREKGPSRQLKYIDGMIDWMDRQFVENEVTKTFPLLLVDVYASIWQTGTLI